jgi:predicted permease
MALPCLIFNSILTAKVGAESLAIMGMLFPFVLGVTLWAFRKGMKKYPYKNLPMISGAQESGMLGVPLFLILFGSANVYHMVILDLTQAIVGQPTIAIVSCDAGDSPKPGEILKKVFTSPLVIACLIALGLNLSGAGTLLLESGIGQVVTEVTTFLGQPVSTLMIFSVGYNLSLSAENRGEILKLCLLRLTIFSAIAGVLQLLLCLIPNITALTRWAMLLYCLLPASYIAPSLGKTEQERTVASGVSSLLTVVTLAVFCAIAALTA